MSDRKNSYPKRFDKTNIQSDDVTEYGEFVATFDAWMTPEELKKRADHLARLKKEK